MQTLLNDRNTFGWESYCYFYEFQKRNQKYSIQYKNDIIELLNNKHFCSSISRFQKFTLMKFIIIILTLEL